MSKPIQIAYGPARNITPRAVYRSSITLFGSHASTVIAAAVGRHASCLEALIEAGARLNVQDNCGYTAVRTRGGWVGACVL